MYSAVFGDKLPVMTDYKSHFRLSKEPFAAIAAGTDVFVAPQVASTMAAIKKALAVEDAVVTVSGPVGCGKTTIARRALEGAAEFHVIVTIGRIQFGHDEVLELLLAGLGVRQLPKSTVHRFATFRRVLQQYAEQKTRVFILVEDATRVGFDALTELEAVTSADAGVSGGANLVLLGDESLGDFLRDPRLARIKQRIRARQKLAAQTESEMRGYLKHSFRLAGQEFDTIFREDCYATLHSLSGGVPRMINNLVTAALDAAAEQDLGQVGVDLVERVASEEFGLTGSHRVADLQPQPEPAPEPETVAEIAPGIEPQPAPEPIAKAAVEAVPACEPQARAEPEATPEPQPEAEPLPLPLPDVSADAAPPQEAMPPAEEADDDIPELIQDTLPDLQILAPQLMPENDATSPDLVADSEAAVERPAVVPDDASEIDLPVLSFPGGAAEKSTEEPVIEAAEAALDIDAAGSEPVEPEEEAEPADELADAEEIPAWERDPTLAELRPDLDALERAMAVAQGTDEPEEAPSVLEENLAGLNEPPEAAADQAAAEPESLDIVPEITLDKQIQAKIDEATEALKQTQVDATAELGATATEAPATETGESATKPERREVQSEPAPAIAESTPATPVIDLPAADNSKADQELEKIASELAKAKTIEDVDDKMAETLFGEEFSMIAAQVAANAPSIDDDEVEVAAGTPAGETIGAVALSLEDDEPQVMSAPEKPPEATLDTSSSQRLQVLRDLNKTAPPPGAPPVPDEAESIVMSGGGVELPPATGTAKVDSIEDQISTSMTQTLKALNINQLPQNDADEVDDETGEKKGLFGFFRKK